MEVIPSTNGQNWHSNSHSTIRLLKRTHDSTLFILLPTLEGLTVNAMQCDAHRL